MYRYKLLRLEVAIDDTENHQHKKFGLQKPKIGSSLDELWRFAEQRIETLKWLPNGHKEAGMVIDLTH